MTKTFNISCEISLFKEFKQLIIARGDKVSTVIQEFMQSELNQANRDYEDIEERLKELEQAVTNLINQRSVPANET
jgi:hypothetical protein